MSEIIQDIKGGDFSSFLDKINALLNYKLLMVGETNLTIGLFLGLTFSIILVFVISELARKFLANKILARYKLELGMRQSIATIFKYLLIIIGLVTILQNSNVDLSALGILAGAIGVGIGACTCAATGAGMGVVNPCSRIIRFKVSCCS